MTSSFVAAELRSPGRRRFSDPLAPVTTATLREQSNASSAAHSPVTARTDDDDTDDGDTSVPGVPSSALYRQNSRGALSTPADQTHASSTTSEYPMFPPSASSISPHVHGTDSMSEASPPVSRSHEFVQDTPNSELDSTTGRERHEQVTAAVRQSEQNGLRRLSINSGVNNGVSPSLLTAESLTIRSDHHFEELLMYDRWLERQQREYGGGHSVSSPDANDMAIPPFLPHNEEEDPIKEEKRARLREEARLDRVRASIAALGRAAVPPVNDPHADLPVSARSDKSSSPEVMRQPVSMQARVKVVPARTSRTQQHTQNGHPGGENGRALSPVLEVTRQASDSDVTATPTPLSYGGLAFTARPTVGAASRIRSFSDDAEVFRSPGFVSKGSEVSSAQPTPTPATTGTADTPGHRVERMMSDGFAESLRRGSTRFGVDVNVILEQVKGLQHAVDIAVSKSEAESFEVHDRKARGWVVVPCTRNPPLLVRMRLKPPLIPPWR
jgi:hypothetical protein